MRGDQLLSIPVLLGFLLTLVRIAGVFVFVPLPGMNSTVNPARIVFTLAITIALFPLWPQVTAEPSAGAFVMWVLVEAALGIGIGLAVAFVLEAFSIGAQMMGLQAGYSFASTVDPNTQADSTVLVVFSQMAAGLLFFASGLDREVLHIFARSLQVYPAGSFALTHSAAKQVLFLGSGMFSTGLRLALPALALMVMIDISLALLGRVNSQLQMLHLAMPVKMAAGLTLMAWLSLLLPAILRAGSQNMFEGARWLFSH